MEESLASKLRKIIDIKIRNITKDFYQKKSLENCIKLYENNITTYLDYNTAKNPN